MIYYFSGTGNSLMVCKLLAKELQDDYSAIVSPKMCMDSTIGLIFPVYAWGMPKIVENFIINTLPTICQDKSCYFYIVMTCGDDIGYADKLVSKAMKKIGINLTSIFSVQMPNTYVSLPGFDVDSKKLAYQKISMMKKNIFNISNTIKNCEKDTKITRGKFPWLKSYLLRPLFNKFFMSDKRFWVEKTCICCGKCAKHCPMKNIEIGNKGGNFSFVWKKHCEGCMGCYHICPMHAIQYWCFTRHKGQKDIFS